MAEMPDDLSGCGEELDSALVLGIGDDDEIVEAATKLTRIGERLAALAERARPMDHMGTRTVLELSGQVYALVFYADSATGGWRMGVVRAPDGEEED